MPITFGINIQALRGLRGLEAASGELQQGLQRIATGSRINRAADDAAGLSIASALRADSRVFAQAIRNLNDGISVIGIASDALSQLANIVTRQQELAEQSANGVYSSAQRNALDVEARALTNEYNRILDTTSFNGLSLFSSENSTIRLQAGYGLHGSLAVTLGSDNQVGTGTFTQQGALALGNSPKDIEFADINRDGKLDVISVEQNSDVFTIRFGNGDGTFSAPTSHAAGSQPNSVLAIDLNGDSVIDLVSANRGSDTVSVRIGNSNGSFAAAVAYATGDITTANDLVSGDFNGDGRIDLVTSNRGSNSFSVLLGNGNGTFQARTDYIAGSSGVLGITVGDVNGDSKSDVIVTSDYINGVVFLGSGSGTLSVSGTYATGNATFAVRLADVNQDGKSDMVAANAGDSTVTVLLGNSNGSFSAAVTYTLGTALDPRNLELGDLNGDGYADIVVANYAGSVSVLLNSGTGTFNSARSYSAGSATNAIALGDMNGDGVTDIAAVNYLSDDFTVLIGSAVHGTRAMHQSFLTLTSAVSARSALDELNVTLAEISSRLSVLGAAESRILVASSTLAVSRENVIAAGSRITDADIAAEFARVTRTSILQKVSISVLAQANLQPQIGLRLLQDL